MKDQMQQFYSMEFGDLAILMIEGKPYFPAAECAEVLGYNRPHNAISRHCVHSLKRGVVTRATNQHSVTSEQTVEKIFIPEGDLYRLIIRSKLPAAERFERWVFDTVLPTIREQSAYLFDKLMEEAIKGQEFAFGLITELEAEKSKTAALLDRLGALSPKALYCDRILQSTNVVPASLIAKDYGMTVVAFNNLLHDLRIQYKLGRTWILYQPYAAKGYTKTRTYLVSDETSAMHTYWTQAGRLFLYEKLKGYGIMPLMESGRTTVN